MRRAFSRATIVFLIAIIILAANLQFEEKLEVSYHLGLHSKVITEISFALIVAVFIWLLFDFFSKDERDQEWKRRIEDISNDVFRAVLGKQLPEGLKEAANAAVLNQKFVRSNVSVTYVINNLDDKSFPSLSDLTKFALIEVIF